MARNTKPRREEARKEKGGGRIYWRPESKTWWLDFYGADGRRVRRSSGAADEKEAQSILVRAVERERALKAAREPTNLRLWDDVAFAYIESLTGGARSGAIAAAKRSRAVLEGKRLADIDTTETLDALFTLLARPRTHGRARTPRVYAKGTQLLTLAFVRSVFKHAGVRNRVLDDYEPVRDLGEIGHRERFATREEEAALAQAAGHDWRWDYLSFAIDTGLRMSEQRALAWSDVHLDHYTPHLQITWGKTKKKRSRVVPLNARAVAVLKRQPRFPGCSLVFWRPTTRSNGYTRGSYTEAKPVPDPYLILCGLCAEVGIPTGAAAPAHEKITYHDLRHTFAQRRLAEGMRIEVLSKIMGHSQITMTMRYLSFQKDAVLDEFNRVQSELRAKGESWAQPMGTVTGTVLPLAKAKKS